MVPQASKPGAFRRNYARSLLGVYLAMGSLLITADSSAALCPQTLADYNNIPVGTSGFELRAQCLSTLLSGSLKYTGEDPVFQYQADVDFYCTTRTKVEEVYVYTFINRGILGTDGYSNKTLHNLPPRTQCMLIGCYMDYSSHPFIVYSLRNTSESSCSIPENTSVSSLPRSPSLSPSPSLSISSPYTPPMSLPLFTTLEATIVTSPVSLTPLLTSTQRPAPQQHTDPHSLMTEIATAVSVVILTIAVALSCVALALGIHHSRTRRILKVGQDDWRHEVLQMDYNPLDWSKMVTSSQDSILQTLFTGQENSLAAPSIEDTNTGAVEDLTALLDNTSFRGAVAQRGLAKLCDKSASIDIPVLSGNTSGYSTGCNSNYGMGNPSTLFPRNSSAVILSGGKIDACTHDLAFGDATHKPGKRHQSSDVPVTTHTSVPDDPATVTSRQNRNTDTTLSLEQNRANAAITHHDWCTADTGLRFSIRRTSSTPAVISNSYQLHTKHQSCDSTACVNKSRHSQPLYRAPFQCSISMEDIPSSVTKYSLLPRQSKLTNTPLCYREAELSTTTTVAAETTPTSTAPPETFYDSSEMIVQLNCDHERLRHYDVVTSTCLSSGNCSGSLRDYAGYIHIETPL